MALDARLKEAAERGIRRFAPAVGAGVAAAGVTGAVLGVALPRAHTAVLAHVAAAALVGLISAVAVARRRFESSRAMLTGLCVTAATGTLALGYVALTQPELVGGLYSSSWAGKAAALGAAVWGVAFLLERRTGRWSAVFTGALGGLALAACLLATGTQIRGALSGELRVWNVFHYYVGSKYFAELGFDGLYAATLASDNDWQKAKLTAAPYERERMKAVKDFRHVRTIRDVNTYQLVSRSQAVSGFDKSRFSKTRFAEFGDDTRVLRAMTDKSTSRGILKDLGYNPSPAWTVFGTPFANLVPLTRVGCVLIAISDLVALVLTFAAVAWAFGARVAFAALLWLVTIPFNSNLLVGGLLHYDWLASVAIGFALYHKGWSRLGGVVMSWGVMTRVFPALLVVPIAIGLAASWVRRRRSKLQEPCEAPRHAPDPRRSGFMRWLAVSCVVLFCASHFTGRGANTWPDWLSKIELHSRMHPTTSSKRIGLARLLLHSPAPGEFWHEARPYEVPSASAGSSSAGSSSAGSSSAGQPLKVALQVAGLALLLLGAWGRRDEDAVLLMMFAIFLLVTLSRYYASIWMLLFALGASRQRSRISRSAAFAGVVLPCMTRLARWPEGFTGQYFLVNYVAVLLFTVLCIALGAPRVAAGISRLFGSAGKGSREAQPRLHRRPAL